MRNQQKRTTLDVFIIIFKGIYRCFCFGLMRLFDYLEYLATFLAALSIGCAIYAKNSDETYMAIALWLGSILVGPIIFGLYDFNKYLRYEKKLKVCGLSRPNGWPLHIDYLEEYLDGTLAIHLDIWGIDPQEFIKKKGVIESTFGRYFHELRESASPRYKELWLTLRSLPSSFKFDDAIKSITKPYHIVIGQNINGSIISDISQWPHGLIAGSTGSGKSIQMKSIVAQFIHSMGLKDKNSSSPSAQIILCDLKGGVEFSSFEGIPNVAIYSEIKEITKILKVIRDEMQDRFKLMREKGVQKIIPERDNRDFILIAIDESSLLYRKVLKGEPHYFDIQTARNITQEILKLGRAAKISVLFGLQRPSKESIDTEVQENIDARICLKVNTIEGSVRMLGHKGGVNLPAIPGRGIWKMGMSEELFQAPLITMEDIKKLKSRIKEKIVAESNPKKQRSLAISSQSKVLNQKEIGLEKKKRN